MITSLSLTPRAINSHPGTTSEQCRIFFTEFLLQDRLHRNRELGLGLINCTPTAGQSIKNSPPWNTVDALRLWKTDFAAAFPRHAWFLHGRVCPNAGRWLFISRVHVGARNRSETPKPADFVRK